MNNLHLYNVAFTTTASAPAASSAAVFTMQVGAPQKGNQEVSSVSHSIFRLLWQENDIKA